MDEIVKVDGLTAVVIGANDLAGSMGHMGNPQHPDVQSAIEKVVTTAKDAGIYPGIGMVGNAEVFQKWLDKGIQWVQVGVDWWHLANAIDTSVTQLRQGISSRNT